MKYLKRSLEKIDRSFIKPTLLNILYYIGITLILIVSLAIFKVNYDSLSSTMPFLESVKTTIEEGRDPSMDDTIMDQVDSIQKKYDRFRYIMYTIAFFAAIMIIALSALIKHKIYCIMQHKKTSYISTMRIIIFWSAIWAILIGIIYQFVSLDAFKILIVSFAILYSYFSMILSSSLASTIKGAKLSLKKAVLHIHKYSAPILFALLFATCSWYLTKLFLGEFSTYLRFIVFGLLYLIIINWMRIYLSLIIHEETS